MNQYLVTSQASSASKSDHRLAHPFMQLRESSTVRVLHNPFASPPLLHCCYASLPPQLHNSTTNLPRSSHPSCASASPLMCEFVAIFAWICRHFPGSVLIFARTRPQFWACPSLIMRKKVAILAPVRRKFRTSLAPFSRQSVTSFLTEERKAARVKRNERFGWIFSVRCILTFR